MFTNRRTLLLGAISVTALGFTAAPADAASRADLDRKGRAALQSLYSAQPNARMLADKAVGILVFPSIVKGGFVFGAQTGNGVLFKGTVPDAYYNISSASFGLQAGVQAFSYALFFMKQSALGYLEKSMGWSIGSGPNVVVLDKGAAASITSTTLSQDVYAIPFGAQGLMAGIGLEGSKITRIEPGP